ncbi:calcineurin-like phosphoesterase [bacterium BMS3Abin01]|nr:calcineurin-like phosphoesterase [bacterium BMS3Abin01]
MLVAAVMAACLWPAAGCSGDAGAGTAQATRAGSSGTVVPAADVSYRFAVCGDNRLRGIENGVLERIVESARNRGAGFIVDNGDLTNNGTVAELELYRSFTESSGIRFYSVIGNHDLGPVLAGEAYREVIGPLYYSFDYAGDHFIVVDNADLFKGIDTEQLQWLIRDLQDSAGMGRQFVFAHVPMNSPADDDGFAAERTTSSEERFLQAATAQANLAAFFFGHLHGYAAYDIDGTAAYVSGGGGAPLNPAKAVGFYHYLLVTVSPEGVQVEVVRV